MSYCLNYLTQNVSKENVIETWTLAVEFNFDRLQEKCAEVIEEVIKEIPKSKLKETAVAHPLVFGEIFKCCITKPFFVSQLTNVSGQTQKDKPVTQLVSPDSDCLRDFEEMFNSQLLSDVELAVDGKIFNAHKNVLSSKFF
jgi:hypothetical protein